MSKKIAAFTLPGVWRESYGEHGFSECWHMPGPYFNLHVALVETDFGSLATYLREIAECIEDEAADGPSGIRDFFLYPEDRLKDAAGLAKARMLVAEQNANEERQ